MCNVSVVQADSNAPTECRISINNNALYTNNRYVTLDLYGVDANAMQVWISNDGENGTVLDFAYNTTYTITDQNYVVGVELDSSNSTTSTNSDNVLRVENWPLSSINGTKKIYAVFRDAYGNKTSTTGLTTITITYNLNGVTGTAPSAVTTVKNLGVFMPNVISSAANKAFLGWSVNPAATAASYTQGTLASLGNNTTLYAIYKTISVGDYVYYTLDSTKRYDLQGATSGTGSTQTFSIASKFSNPMQVFKVIESSATSIKISPMNRSQVFQVSVNGATGYYNVNTIASTICRLYATNYSSSTSIISDSLMAASATDADFSSLFAEYGFNGNVHEGEDGQGTKYFVHYSRIGSYNNYTYIWYLEGGYGPTITAYVYPVITLNTNVRCSGNGTSTSPYNLIALN